MINFLERILVRSRYMVLVPVVALLATSGFIFIWTLSHYVILIDIFNVAERDLIIGLISIIDLFLLGVLTLIISISLFELYISPGKPGESSLFPKTLVVTSLDGLKERVGKVVYLILLVTFFRYAVQFNYSSMHELLMLAGSILLISLSLYFQGKKAKIE